MFLKTSTEDKKFFNELSALSGYSQDNIREIYEMSLINVFQSIVKNPTGVTTVRIPFLGEVGLRYNGDIETSDGYIEADFDTFINIDPKFKRIAGDMLDEKVNVIDNLMRAKLDEAISDELD